MLPGVTAPSGAADLAVAAFEVLPSSAVVLDPTGVVVLVNDSWREFGRRNGAGPGCGVGSDYLAVCARSAARGDELAGVTEAALRSVLEGHAPRAELDYPCHTPTQQRWFHLLARPLGAGKGVLVLHEEISSRVREVAQLRHAATHDPLTGLANRLLLEDHLATALRAGDRRRESSVAVLVVDVDGFKAVNDRYGHLAGDALLAALARRLSALGRAQDTVARWGGDEFVLVLPGCTGAGAQRRREQEQRVVALPVELPEGLGEVRVTASVGAALGGPGDDARDLLARADLALLRGRASQGLPRPRGSRGLAD